MPRLLATLALFAPSALSGCIGADARSEHSTTRDSAGIQIVESGRAAWRDGGAWRLSDEPTLSIGTVEGAPQYQFFRVVGAHRMSNGTIAVANAGTHEIRYYDADGRFLHAAGGSGGGPGEYLMLVSTTLSNDTLFAYDRMQQRISVLDRDGRFVRSFSLTGGEGSLPPSPIGRFADGSWAVAWTQQFDPSSGLVRDSAIYLRIGEERGVRQSIGRFLGVESIVHPVDVGHSGYYFRPVPYGRRSRAVVLGSRLIYGTSDVYEFAVYDQNGEMEKLIRKAHMLEPIGDADLRAWDAADESFRASLPPAAPAMLRQPASEVPRPPTKATHGEVRVDAAGSLWVAEYTFPRHTPNAWTVFDSDGIWLGQVTTPDGFRISEIGDDYVLGVQRDDLEVESIQMYSLVKQP